MSTYLAGQIRAVADNPTPAGMKALLELARQVERMELALDEIVAIEHRNEQIRAQVQTLKTHLLQWQRRQA